MTPHIRSLLTVMVAGSLIPGCGGGGGSSSNTQTPVDSSTNVAYAVDDFVLGGDVVVFGLGQATAAFQTKTGDYGRFELPKTLTGQFRVEVSGGLVDLDGLAATTSDQTSFTGKLTALVELKAETSAFVVSAATTGIAQYTGNDFAKYLAAFAKLPPSVIKLHQGYTGDVASDSTMLAGVSSFQNNLGFSNIITDLTDDGTFNSADTGSEAIVETVASASVTSGPISSMADASLRLCVANSLEKQPEAVTSSDLAAINRLVCEDYGIRTVSGIGVLQSLFSFHAAGNDIEDVAPFANLPKLEVLNLINNRVSTLKPLRDKVVQPITMFIADNCIVGQGELVDDGKLITSWDHRFRKQYSNCLKNDAELLSFQLRGALGTDGVQKLSYRTTYNALASCQINWGDGTVDGATCDGIVHYTQHQYLPKKNATIKFLVNSVEIGNLSLAGSVASIGKLNDTGIQFCGAYSSGNNSPCLGTEPAGQDANYGRDAQAKAGTLTKVGGGEAGFDFTALDASGNPTTPSSGANPHPCVRDNVTALTWEVKTADGGLRDQNWTYTWYDSASPDGYPGTASGGTCYQSGRCDTEKYVADVNAAGLCGYHDWRMPTVRELEGIVHLGRVGPAIDSTYFPNTQSVQFWSSSPVADNSDHNYAWRVYFREGSCDRAYRTGNNLVRLVRGGQ